MPRKTASHNALDLHVHSGMSLYDGLGSPKAIVDRAVELGWGAVSITDHGHMMAAPQLYAAARAAKIKPIVGCEMYVVGDDDLVDGDKEVLKERRHLTVLALSWEGYQNLVRWQNVSMERPLYYNGQRISIERMAETALHGLHHNVVLSGCLGGECCQCLIHGNGGGDALAEMYLTSAKSVFPNFYVELMNQRREKFVDTGFTNYETMVDAMDFTRDRLLQLAQKLDIPVIVTNDSHYQRREQRKPHMAMLARKQFRRSKDSHEGDSRESTVDEFYAQYSQYVSFMQPMEPIAETLPTWAAKQAIESIHEIVAESDVHIETLDKFSYTLPRAKSDDPIAEIRRRCQRRLKLMIARHGQVAADRFEYELSAMKEFVNYLLIYSDIVRIARDLGAYTWTRGSGCASMVCFCLGVHQIDPIHYKLLFERFVNPARAKFPDLDIDIEKHRRDDVARAVGEYMDEIGQEMLAICTYGTLSNRATFRLIAEANGVPQEKIDELAKLLPQMIDSGMVSSDEEAYEILKEQLGIDAHEDAAAIFDTIGTVSQHACLGGETEVYTQGGIQRLADIAGSTQSLLTKKGWVESKVKSFGAQSLNSIVFRQVVNRGGRWGRHWSYLRSQERRIIRATPDHRWVLEDGTVTQSLAIGDVVSSVVDPGGVKGDAYMGGFKHGLVFGDGSKMSQVNRFQLQLFGKKRRFSVLFEQITVAPPSRPESIYCYMTSSVDLKDFPPEGSSPDYVRGFVDGWTDTDGSYEREDTVVISSIKDGTYEWLKANAPLAGWVVTGTSIDPSLRTNYGVRSKPLRKIVMSQKPLAWRVESIDEDGVEEVFCAQVPGEMAFTLVGGVYTGNCAFVIGTTARPLSEWVPVYRIGSSNAVVTQYNMKWIEALGFLKLDLLRLDTLSILHSVARQLGHDMSWIDSLGQSEPGIYDAPADGAMRLLCEGKTDGVFTFQGGTQRRGCIEVQPETTEDLIAIQALYRPGATRTGNDEKFVKRRRGEVEWSHVNDLTAARWDETYGIPIYQEQIMELGFDMGMTGEEVDDLYKAIKLAKGVGRGAAEAFANFEPTFRKYTEGVMPEEAADAIWTEFDRMQGYSLVRLTRPTQRHSQCSGRSRRS